MVNKLYIYLFILIFLNSCVSYEQLQTINADFIDQKKSELVNYKPLRVKVDDVLSIRVPIDNQDLKEEFNLFDENNVSVQANNRVLIGYLVDVEGNIDIPKLGKIQVRGKTISEVKDLIQSTLKEEYKLTNPTVVVKLLNFRVTIMGEVRSPATIFAPSERFTVFDAIGAVGGFTDFSDKSQVVIVRERNNERVYQKLNLKELSIFESEYFYLEQNDLIIINALEEKTAAVQDKSQKIVPWVSVVAALLTLTITLANL